jgi:hypothetical protein
MMHRLLRELVLRTNRFGPFQKVYNAIYNTAVACFVHTVARKRPMVRSIYLRRGQNGHKWIPGLSDIDSTVILAASSSPKEEYLLLEDFWAAYRRLRKLFPMLGEVEVLVPHELGAWLANTGWAPGRRAWELIYGEQDAGLAFDATPDWPLSALRLAWWIYEDLLPPCIAQPDSHVRNRDIQRRVDKIFRLLGPVFTEAGQPAPVASHGDAADMVASALGALESAAVHLFPVPRTDGRVAVSRRPQKEPSSILLRSRRDEGQMLVVEDGLDREALAGLILKNCQGKQNTPLLLSRCLLEYGARFHNPYDYAALSCDWIAEGGKHPLEHVPPPGEREFRQHLLDRFRHLQITSRGEDLFTSNLTVDQVSNALMMVAALRLLQDGRLVPCRDDIRKLFPVEFPEYEQAVEKIGSLITKGSQPEARWQYFFLLRSVVNQLGALIDARNPVFNTKSAP